MAKYYRGGGGEKYPQPYNKYDLLVLNKNIALRDLIISVIQYDRLQPKSFKTTHFGTFSSHAREAFPIVYCN